MRDLPSGTVTFLFTDVEGSTRLLHSLGPEGYAEALAEHRRVIREACVGHDGVEVDTQGDAFFFAFPTAPGALAAAGDMTEALASGAIQVRVGLHTGTPLLTDEGYVGSDVHFAARVAASGHGGQVLVSSATVTLVGRSNSLLQGLSLLDLGEHRLKDIEAPVSIFQLGEGSFPPLKTISNTNLPRPASSFVGRADELEAVLSRIEAGARLVTLTGPGGTGKTRLALEAASSLVPTYKAGVFWVALAALRDPALVTETISQTLGAKDCLAEHISEREMLLLLDNLEQVIEAAPELSSLLVACPNLTLLVTSRELLRVQGEVEYPVPSLAEPEAVSLFCERAQTEPSEEISELCARLDSLPLAVELAAARTRALSPAQILERLSQRLDLLKGGRDADPRQQTLRATIEWSYDLLSPEEQQIFARLSVFQGGCTLEAAEQVSDADLDTLQSLVDKSLLRFTNERYWMLETIREYAGERVEASGEAADIRARHAAYFARVAGELWDGLRAGETSAYATIRPEDANIRAALFSASERGAAEVVADLIGGLWVYWLTRGSGAEARSWAEHYLESFRPLIGELDRFDSDLGASEILRFTGDPGVAEKLKLECLAVSRSNPDASCHGRPLSQWTPALLSDLSHMALEGSRLDAARAYAQEALELRRDVGDLSGVAHALAALAAVEYSQRQFEPARELWLESYAGWTDAGRTQTAAAASLEIVGCDLMLGRSVEARDRLRQAVAMLPDAVATAVHSLRLAAVLAVTRHDAVRCAALFGLADRLERESGMTMFGSAEDADHRSFLERAKRELDDDAFRAAYSEGESAPDAQWLDLVRASLD